MLCFRVTIICNLKVCILDTFVAASVLSGVRRCYGQFRYATRTALLV